MGTNCVWTKKKHRFDKQIRIMINQLFYFTVSNLVLLQCTDILTAINPAPLWENLYLKVSEADFISCLIKTDKPRAIKLKLHW